ncbi:MAG: HAMP domain-containing histidine kinase, partial [Anaerolineales bacterium]|nr:HAMP domain-containing histidine kinase [Anaerolineales bacterium]
PPDKRVYMADIILRSERTLLEIVNNILDIEKLQSGAPIVLDRENVDLTQVVGEIAEVSEGQALEKEIVLSFNRPDDPIFIQLDPQKIKRVLQNVISNAIKYTPDEGQVDVAVQRNGQYAYVVVRDTGYGIPANELPYIFNRYRRVEGHKGRAVGTGLGLAIVKSLVEAHEGEITVESEVNVGSTFTLKLPL